MKITNKVLREKSPCVVCRSSQSRFSKQKHNGKKYLYRRDTENIDLKMVRTKNNRLIKQSKSSVFLPNYKVNIYERTKSKSFIE